MESCYLITLILVIAWVSPAASQPHVLQRYNYGVLFNHVGHVYPKKSFWPHTFHFSLPSLTDWKPIENWCAKPGYSELCSEYSFLINLAVAFTNQTHHQFRHTLQAAYDLLPDSPLPLTFLRVKDHFCLLLVN